MSEGRGTRRTRQIVRWTTWGAMLLGAVVAVNYVSAQYFARWDLTEQEKFTLSESTRDLLDNLDEHVVMTFFLRRTPRRGGRRRRNRRAIEDLLREFASRSSNLSLRILPPEQWPDRVRSLAERYELDEDRLRRREPVLISAEGSDRHRLIPFRRLLAVRPDDGNNRSTIISFSRGERHLSSALFSLIRGGPVTISFTTGHGEAAIEGEPKSNRGAGYHSVRRALTEDEGYSVETINLSQHGSVPEETDLLVIAGPERPFSTEERNRVRRYLEDGGRVMVLVEPWGDTGLRSLLSGYGISLTDRRVMEGGEEVPSLPRVVRLNRFVDHPITAPLKNVNLPVYMRSIRVLEKTSPSGEGATSSILLHSLPDAWATSDREAVRRGREAPENTSRGSFPVAMAATTAGGKAEAEDDRTARLVVFGDVDWLSSRFLATLRGRSDSGNLDLFLNAVRWATGLSDEIRVIPEAHRSRMILVTRAEASTVFTLVVVLIPGCFLVLGVAVWWFRRVRK